MNSIAEYTKDQLILFYEQSIKLDAGRRASFINDVRASVWADGKDLGNLVKALLNISSALTKGD